MLQNLCTGKFCFQALFFCYFTNKLTSHITNKINLKSHPHHGYASFCVSVITFDIAITPIETTQWKVPPCADQEFS